VCVAVKVAPDVVWRATRSSSGGWVKQTQDFHPGDQCSHETKSKPWYFCLVSRDSAAIWTRVPLWEARAATWDVLVVIRHTLKGLSVGCLFFYWAGDRFSRKLDASSCTTHIWIECFHTRSTKWVWSFVLTVTMTQGRLIWYSVWDKYHKHVLLLLGGKK